MLVLLHKVKHCITHIYCKKQIYICELSNLREMQICTSQLEEGNHQHITLKVQR